MGLLRRKQRAADRAATEIEDGALEASHGAVATATDPGPEPAGDARPASDGAADRAADRAAEKLARQAQRARERADAAGRRADKASRKAGRKAAAASKKARKAAGRTVDTAAARAADAKAERKAARYAAKTDAGARKAEAKAVTAQTKTQAKADKAAADQAEKQRQAKEWNAAKAKRYIALGKVLAPVLAPYAMAVAGSLRHRWDDHRSRKLGVSPDELGGYSGRGGHLHARLSRIARTFGELTDDGTTERSAEAKAFVERNEPRLHDFAAAVRAAEQMPAHRRKAAFRAISNDLDRIEVELLSFLGVRS